MVFPSRKQTGLATPISVHSHSHCPNQQKRTWLEAGLGKGSTGAGDDLRIGAIWICTGNLLFPSQFVEMNPFSLFQVVLGKNFVGSSVIHMYNAKASWYTIPYYCTLRFSR